MSTSSIQKSGKGGGSTTAGAYDGGTSNTINQSTVHAICPSCGSSGLLPRADSYFCLNCQSTVKTTPTTTPGVTSAVWPWYKPTPSHLGPDIKRSTHSIDAKHSKRCLDIWDADEHPDTIALQITDVMGRMARGDVILTLEEASDLADQLHLAIIKRRLANG